MTKIDDIQNTIVEEENIEVLGARVHNLKNIDVTIPRNKLTVVTGLSGSGKSSLAFNTIHAEGQRRYIETFSSYARQFLGGFERPDVDKISGLSPVISIEQKTTNKNPRSTVGTVTEIYDFLRLLFAKASDAYSYNTGKKMVKYSEHQITELIIEKYRSKKIYILSPSVKGRKGHYKELFETIRKKGFLHVRVDGEIREIEYGMKLDRYKNHNIEIVIDKLKLQETYSDDKDDIDLQRLKKSVELAMNHGGGVLMIQENDSDETRYFSRNLMCPDTGISYDEPAPHSFSFNSPAGACLKCNGLGKVKILDNEKIIPDNSKSIKNGGILLMGKYSDNLMFKQVEAILQKYDLKLTTPIKKIPEEVLNKILFGTNEKFVVKATIAGMVNREFNSFTGVVNIFEFDGDGGLSKELEEYISEKSCPECNGARLKKESLFFKINEKDISEYARLDLEKLSEVMENIEETFSDKQKLIAHEILKEIRSRISFLLDVGLGYLSLDRTSKTLSGGESQRIRLATQIGSQLVNVLYILDEPSIGLHQRDNQKLINSLEQLRDIGNSVIVVEHDKDMIESADHIVDLGPGAGRHGGHIVAEGTPKDILNSDSLTARYLNKKREISVPKERREGNGKNIKLKGATGNNLKNVTLDLPLGKFVCVTGVSGSGKSSLINGTLHPILSKHFYRSSKTPLDYKDIEGIDNINKVIVVDQTPLGRTPRSNPATYTGMFSDIRQLFVQLPEAKIRGYKPGRFSFNVKGGRCETCKGAGVKTIEMNFLPDVYVECDECHGKRYNRETLEVRFKGKSISDVLNMTINMACEFFDSVPKIFSKLKALQDVGLGYIKLGQPSTTLSGGESQRVKLATELAKRDTGDTLYILDEPTTGLHFEDVNVLLKVLNRIVNKGNTVVVIEHNMDVIKVADHIVDIGPEGGVGGGEIIAEGTPEEVSKKKKSFTARFLKQELN